VIAAEVHRHLESEGRLEDEEHRAEAEADTRESLTQQILLDVLAEQLEVKVSQQELIDYLVNAAQQYGMEPNQFISMLDQQGQIPAMVGEVGRSKSVAVALRRVVVVDSSGGAVDLTSYVGTDDEPEPTDVPVDASADAPTDIPADVPAED
jgi:trigger factor